MSATIESSDAESGAAARSDQDVAAVASKHHRGRALIRRIDTTVRQESLLLALLAGSFLARWLLADRSGYWFDELLSVNTYGLWHDSVFEALRHLAYNSIHPPLYQFILFHWMELFGDSERATRSLSNVYITLATLFTYLMLRNAFSKRVALASAMVFALMYTPMYYAMETRSYAQTIMLVTLSSYLLVRMMRIGADRGWREALVSPMAVLFTSANAGLLLTHYYNAFFWIAQAGIVTAFMLREAKPRRWPAGLTVVAVLYGVQGSIFAIVWGRFVIADFRRRGGAFAVEDGVRSPVELIESVLRLNIDPPRLLAVAGLAVIGLLVFRAGVALAKPRGWTTGRQQAWTVFYLVGWVLLPLIVAYIAFEVTGVARYSPRYWLYIVPAAAPLIVLGVREVIRLTGRMVRNRWGVGTHPAWPAAALLSMVSILILPGTLAAATAEKYDWRGIVRQVVDVVEADAGSSYIIYEAGWRSRPMTTYYFERFASEIEPYGTVRGAEEELGEYEILTTDVPVIAEHDYLILLFPHMRVGQFPDLIAELNERYEVRHRQISASRHGFIIYAVR